MREAAQGMQLGEVHATAIVSATARLGRNVTVGAGALIHDNVEIGDDVVVGPYAIVGEPLAAYYNDRAYQNPPLSVGPGSLIRSHSVIYAGCTMGERFECGHHAMIREFSRIGEHCRIGTMCYIDGDCQIGDYARLHSYVQVAKKTVIGNYVWIFPRTVLTNDPYPPSNHLLGVTVEDFAVIATMVVVLPGVRIGMDALVGAGSVVHSDVPPEAVMAGNPAKQIGGIRDMRSRTSGEHVYPWREYFSRGMPWEGIGYEAWSRRREKTPDQHRRSPSMGEP